MISLEEIASRVRVIINEMDTADDTFSEETDSSISEFVRMAVPLLAGNPLYRGPISRLNDTGSVLWIQRPDEYWYALINLPTDYQRLISVQLSEWVRPVFNLLPTNHDLYYAQFYSVPGLGAGPHSPLAFLVDSTTNKAVLAHSATKSGGTFTLEYIATPSISGDQINMDATYAYPLSYLASGLFLQSAGETEAAKEAFSTAMAYLNKTYHTEQTE
jgi:hypothetical protein